jgi:alkanesulfonate monooxygenase SsuD/methylene tetrahydromethanopterin reductase-like flavin-dependent oxidoreductase (luciferase family)
MNLLMTTDDASFEGRYYRLERATYNPKPVQRPRPPLWIGGGGEKLLLPLAARRANVWHGFGRAATLQRKGRIIDDHAERAGRDPASIRRATDLSISEPWDEVLARAEEAARVGITYLTVSWPGQGRGRVDEFVEKVAPKVRELSSSG